MEYSDKKRSIAFTVVLSLLLILSALHVTDRVLLFIQNNPDVQGLRGFYLLDVFVSIGFIILIVFVFRWKRWAMYGIVALGLASGIIYIIADYLIAGGTLYVVKSGLALLAVLVSILSKDWNAMA